MKKLLSLAVVASAMLLIPSTASAATSCSFNSGTGLLSVSVTGTGDQFTTLNVNGANIGVYDNANVLQSCANGPAPVATTSGIAVQDTDPGVQRTILKVSLLGGRFEN